MFCPECGTKLIENPSTGGMTVDGSGNAIDMHTTNQTITHDNSVSHDSHNVLNTDNSVHNINNSTTDNSTNTHIVYEAQKSGDQLHAESVKTFVCEVARLVDSPDGTIANGMLSADSLHRLTLLSMQLMIPQQEAERIIATAQQSKMQALQIQQQQKEAEMKAQMAQQMQAMAPPMPEMPEMPPMPQFNPQNAQLAQMQGFNPLQAAQQMGIGMAGMQMPQMPQMGGMPQMPTMPTLDNDNQ